MKGSILPSLGSRYKGTVFFKLHKTLASTPMTSIDVHRVKSGLRSIGSTLGGPDFEPVPASVRSILREKPL